MLNKEEGLQDLKVLAGRCVSMATWLPQSALRSLSPRPPAHARPIHVRRLPSLRGGTQGEVFAGGGGQSERSGGTVWGKWKAPPPPRCKSSALDRAAFQRHTHATQELTAKTEILIKN